MVNLAEKTSAETEIPSVDDTEVDLLEETLAPRKNLKILERCVCCICLCM